LLDQEGHPGEAYQYRAAARVRLGQYMAALSDCNRAIELDDSDEDVYRTRGAAYVGLQQYEMARTDLDRVLGENKNDAEAYRLRGSALLGMDQILLAFSDYSMSIASNPLSADAYLDHALAYRKLGRSEEADADLEKALQLDPNIGRRR
jgi:tetratricopeptide (TPR) repeat protein